MLSRLREMIRQRREREKPDEEEFECDEVHGKHSTLHPNRLISPMPSPNRPITTSAPSTLAATRRRNPSA